MAAIMLYFVGVTTADECYGFGSEFKDIVDGGITDAIKNFCYDHHGATFKENGEAKGCVDTSKGERATSLNITIEFFSILDKSNVVNFTADACEQVLFSASTKCHRGGYDIIVVYGPNGASRRRKARDGTDSGFNHGGPSQSGQGQDAFDTPDAHVTTTELPLINRVDSTLGPPPATLGTGVLFNTTAKDNDSMKLTETVTVTTTATPSLTATTVTNILLGVPTTLTESYTTTTSISASLKTLTLTSTTVSTAITGILPGVPTIITGILPGVPTILTESYTTTMSIPASLKTLTLTSTTVSTALMEVVTVTQQVPGSTGTQATVTMQTTQTIPTANDAGSTTTSTTEVTAMNSYFAGRIMIDPNDCGCAGCPE